MIAERAELEDAVLAEVTPYDSRTLPIFALSFAYSL